MAQWLRGGPAGIAATAVFSAGRPPWLRRARSFPARPGSGRGGAPYYFAITSFLGRFFRMTGGAGADRLRDGVGRNRKSQSLEPKRGLPSTGSRRSGVRATTDVSSRGQKMKSTDCPALFFRLVAQSDYGFCCCCCRNVVTGCSPSVTWTFFLTPCDQTRRVTCVPGFIALIVEVRSFGELIGLPLID